MTNRSRLDSVHTKIMRLHLRYLLIYSVISQSACEIHPFHAILKQIYQIVFVALKSISVKKHLN